MAFAPENLFVRFASWPDQAAAFWGYKLPKGDTMETVRQEGYFDTATSKLAPGSIVFVENPDPVNGGLAELEMFIVLARKTQEKVDSVSKVQAVGEVKERV